MLPNLSRLSLRAKPVAGTLEDVLNGEDCGICSAPLNADSPDWPWDGTGLFVRQACTNDPGHFFHAGCLRRHVLVARGGDPPTRAVCPDCRAPLLGTVIALAPPAIPVIIWNDGPPYPTSPQAPPPSRQNSEVIPEPPEAPGAPRARRVRRRVEEEDDEEDAPPIDDNPFGNDEGGQAQPPENEPPTEGEMLVDYAQEMREQLGPIQSWIARYGQQPSRVGMGIVGDYERLAADTIAAYATASALINRYAALAFFPEPGDPNHDQFEDMIGEVYILYQRWDVALNLLNQPRGGTPTYGMIVNIRNRLRALLIAILPNNRQPPIIPLLLTDWVFEDDPVLGYELDGRGETVFRIRRIEPADEA